MKDILPNDPYQGEEKWGTVVDWVDPYIVVREKALRETSGYYRKAAKEFKDSIRGVVDRYAAPPECKPPNYTVRQMIQRGDRIIGTRVTEDT